MKLSDAIDGLDDSFLTESLEYDKKRKEEARGELKKHWKRWAVLAASLVFVLMIAGLMIWGRYHAQDGSLPSDGKTEEIVTLIVDARTLMAGKSGEMPVEIKAEATDIEEKAGEPESRVTVTWVYPYYGEELVSKKTVKEINRKLEEDGYYFTVRFQAIKGSGIGGMILDDNEEYQKKLFSSDGDIAFSGFCGAGEYVVQEAIRDGKYAPLEAYLEDGTAWDVFPEVLWKTTSYQGHVYFFPNEVAQDRGNSLYFRKKSFSKAEFEAFDGDLLSVEKYLKEGKVLYYSCSGFSFAETFGYSYYQGVLLTKDGELVNPLEEERCIAWLQLLNRYQDQITQDRTANWDIAFSRSFPGTGFGEENQPEGSYAYTWKGYAVPRLNSQTGILASSGKKQEAYFFLELLRTDRSYAELLLFGKDAVDGKEEKHTSFVKQLILGLDTGLVTDRGNDYMMQCFASAQEKKEYYAENILPSAALELQTPEACGEMLAMEEYAAKLIYTADFDTVLKKGQKKAAEAMKQVKARVK